MNFLLLNLSGPMQSWGIDSKFETRDTILEPTKSGIIGMIASSMGRERRDDITDLRSLKIHVRVDRQGSRVYDFYSIGNGKFQGNPYGICRSNGGNGDGKISKKYFLQDSKFLVAIEHDDKEFLEEIMSNLQSPRFFVYMGRKSYIPPFPWILGMYEKNNIIELFEDVEWKKRKYENSPTQLRCVLEGKNNSSIEREDDPISFSPRRYSKRHVYYHNIGVNNVVE